MSEKDVFLKALSLNEDDTPTRLVYADWLDEHGEHEEADRQRKWPAAKEWLVRLCREFNPPPHPPYCRVISYEELIERAWQAVSKTDKSTYYLICCDDNQDLSDELKNNTKEFWRNWSIVTGISLPSTDFKTYFPCAC